MGVFPPRASTREPLLSKYWTSKLPKFGIPIVITGILIQIVFLGNMSYLYGSLFKSGSRVHALRVLAVDYDGHDIGHALDAAYSSLRADSFPSLEFRSASQYPTVESIEEAMCTEGYWAAIYTHNGASDRLMTALSGENSTAYDPKDTISYTYYSSYYPIVSLSSVVSNMETLISVASRTLYSVSTEALSTVNFTSPSSATAFLDPIRSSSIVKSPTNQGSRVLLNTVTMVMGALMQFFFLMGMNNISAQAGVFNKMSKRDVYMSRLIISKFHTFICALCSVAYIWAFREDWFVTSAHFGKTWMAFWLYMEIQYTVMDTLLEIVIPMQFWSFFVLTWIITNITSTVYPFELTAGFYRVGWALPAHNFWLLLMDIWSNGCKQHRNVVLPVLLCWWLLGHISSAWSVWKRCSLAEANAAILEKNVDDTDASRSVLQTPPE
ncbi:unnamed protein product [Clonostachys rosea f. rosea IK726]|uniref:Uncharacterized protein n=1 Tax=Clonostachys rosea f. rosea IK726 TaxID=1349383 RepID=A0ACA9UUX6_BIOOC|nr:unnamed protein product [Clonostachys rosea f. rosea IK726]